MKKFEQEAKVLNGLDHSPAEDDVLRSAWYAVEGSGFFVRAHGAPLALFNPVNITDFMSLQDYTQEYAQQIVAHGLSSHSFDDLVSILAERAKRTIAKAREDKFQMPVDVFLCEELIQDEEHKQTGVARESGRELVDAKKPAELQPA